MNELIRRELAARVREMLEGRDNSNENVLRVIADLLAALEQPVYA